MSDQRVLVLDSDGKALMPCHPARARQLIRKGRAKAVRRAPFTIQLTDRRGGAVQPLELKLDPGSRKTGAALVLHGDRGVRAVWAAEIAHRGLQIRQGLEKRRAIRRGRRNRKTRYRAPRFLNRTRPAGWLPPSIQSRVDNVKNLSQRLARLAPLSAIAVERVRFDTQAMQNPEISGVEYQQGTLLGYEAREYLLEKYQRACVYCDARNVPLEVEHLHPRSRGGGNRISNLALACRPCNQAKGNRPLEDFLADNPARLERIRCQCKAPLKDAAAVNAARHAVGAALQALGVPVSFWSGGHTKMNRITQGHEKAHWIDAACVGESGAAVHIPKRLRPLEIRALGRGSRQQCRMDQYGFPRAAAKAVKRVKGFQTGDQVRLVQPSGKYAGTHTGTVSVRERGDFDIQVVIAGKRARITAPHHRFRLLQRSDGYAYAAA